MLYHCLIAAILRGKILYQSLQIVLEPWDAALGLGLLGAAFILSRHANGQVMGSLLLAIVRSLVQLIILGYALAIVFALPAGGTVGFLLFLLIITTQFTIHRLDWTANLWKLGLWLLLASGLPSAYAVIVILRPDPWYQPQYWIPFMGLSLGTAAAVALQVGNQFWQVLEQDRHLVETHLSLGATIDQALQPWKRSILQKNLSARWQQISWVGLVTLPLFFGGQLVAGVNPLVAVEYEMLLILVTINSTLIMALAIIQLMEKPWIQY